MNIKKLWIEVLLGMVLVLSLAGEAGARDRAAVSQREYITIPAAAFQPSREGFSTSFNGSYLWLHSPSMGASFLAPVVFPGSSPVVVRKVILYAEDNHWSSVGVTLEKANPGGGTPVAMASAQTTGSASGVREFSDTSITYATVQRTHLIYLRLLFYAAGEQSLRVRAVKIAYTH